MKKKDVKVSVICITYNHEKYIEDALKGFVMQETNFDYEVIVHDDASTDGTRSIIEKYASKYDYIKPIFEKENQFSKGTRLSDTIGPYITGKYITHCDGDDYWADPHKLQKQYDFMESHPDCSFCGHSYTRMNVKNGECEVIETENENGVISMPALLGGKTLHINTIMFRNIDEPRMPDFFYSINGVGDYPLTLFYATKGTACYINDVMSVYRRNTENSWTNRISEHAANAISYLNEMYSFTIKYDNYTDGKFHETIQARLQELKEMIEYYLKILKEKYELEIKQETTIKEQEEAIKNNNETIKKYEDIINKNKTVINNYIESIKSNSQIIENSIQEMNNILECRPYKIANTIHNYFSKLDVSKNILKEKINSISNSINDIKNNNN